MAGMAAPLPVQALTRLQRKQMLITPQAGRQAHICRCGLCTLYLKVNVRGRKIGSALREGLLGCACLLLHRDFTHSSPYTPLTR